MRKIRALLAIILALSLLFATQVTAFAVDDELCCDETHEELIKEGNPESVYYVVEEEEIAPQKSACETYGHLRGDCIASHWIDETDYSKYCYYKVLYQDYKCNRCNIVFRVKANQTPLSRTHEKVYDYSSENQYKGWHCSLCGYYNWK